MKYDVRIDVENDGPFSLAIRDPKRKKWARAVFSTSQQSFEGNDENMLFELIEMVETHAAGEETTRDTLRSLHKELIA